MAFQRPAILSPDGNSHYDFMATTDDLEIGILKVNTNVDANNTLVINVLNPANPQDAATKSYVDNAIHGLRPRGACRALAAANVPLSGLATIDGVSLVDNNRVLLINQTIGIQNGIWEVHVGVWTRPADFPSGGEAAGSNTFIHEGATYMDQTWVCTNDPGAGCIDVHILIWVRLASNLFAGGDGIDISASIISVDLDPTPGLEFNIGKLKIKVGNVNEVNLDANGLRTTGLPAQFFVNNLQVGATVTAAAFDTLTNGSNADSLHVHAGIGGAGVVTEDIDVHSAVLVGSCVRWSVVSNRVRTGNTGSDLDSQIIGVTEAAQPVVGDPVKVVRLGKCSGVLTPLAGLTIGQRIYMTTAGGLSLTIPGAGEWVIQAGYARNINDLDVVIKKLYKKAS